MPDAWARIVPLLTEKGPNEPRKGGFSKVFFAESTVTPKKTKKSKDGDPAVHFALREPQPKNCSLLQRAPSKTPLLLGPEHSNYQQGR